MLEVTRRHAQDTFHTHGGAESPETSRQLANGGKQQRNSVVLGLWRRPAANVVDPALLHAGNTDRRNHRDGFAFKWYQQEPGARGAVPELGQESR